MKSFKCAELKKLCVVSLRCPSGVNGPQREMAQVKTEVDGKTETAGEEAVHLRREIGLLPAVSFIIGTVVGSGIFIAPKGVLMNSGSVGLSLVVWGLCGILSMFGETLLLYCIGFVQCTMGVWRIFDLKHLAHFENRNKFLVPICCYKLMVYLYRLLRK